MLQVWFVTGANRGLGRAITLAALDAGHRVVATAKNRQALDTAFAAVSTERLLPAKLDVTDLGEAHQAAQSAVTAFARIDVLVNNAGYGQLGAFEETTPDQVRAQFETNLFGLMNVTRTVLPVMRRQRAGRIFNIASIGGYGGSNRGGVYSASKFAVVGFTEALATEVAEFGISVTVIAPGYFRTDFLDPSSAEFSSDPICDYAPSSKTFCQGIAGINHAQDGDPAKLGQVLVELAKVRKQPLNFPVGSDAVKYITEHHQHVIDEIAPWRDLSESTSYYEACPRCQEKDCKCP
jgi:NAD(P)-dependent dehydrogenase (short-subunit alcohol dehydrogenase family)